MHNRKLLLKICFGKARDMKRDRANRFGYRYLEMYMV